MVVRGKVA